MNGSEIRESFGRHRRRSIVVRIAAAATVIVVVISAAGCSSGDSGTAKSGQGQEQVSALTFDPDSLPSAQELANVELPETPAGTACGPAEVEPASEGKGFLAYVGFRCEDAAEYGYDSSDSAAATAMFEKIGVLEFDTENAARSAFGPDVIRQEGRESVDVKPATQVPSGTICVESTDGGDESYQRCAFRAGRFIVNATGNEGSRSGAEAGLRVLRQWLEHASQPAQ